MKARLGDDFDVVWDFDEKFYDKDVVTMIFQPIQENCFRYGFKNIDYKGIINISAKENDKFFEISISDNGVGMEDAEIERINEYLRKPPSITESHVGFSNVNSRIVLNFGADYGVFISKNESGGTKVTMKLPNKN